MALAPKLVRLQQEAHNARSLNASRPAVNVPDEILAQIFEWVVHGILNPDGAFHPYIGQSRAPLYRLARNRIAATCRRWRHVAIAASSLWTKLFIHPKYLKDESTEAKDFIDPDMLACDVMNAGERMMSLDMYGSRSPSYLDDWDSTIRPTVTPIAERLRDVGLGWDINSRVQTDVERVIQELLTLFATSCVRQLCLRVCAVWTSFGDVILDLSSTTAAENVHTYFPHIGGFNVPLPVRVPATWNVKNLTLRGTYNPSDVIVALNSCAQLETLMLTCDFTTLSESSGSDGGLTLNSLPFLTTLSVYELPPPHIMNGFEAPALERLRYIDTNRLDRLVDTNLHFPTLHQLIILNRVVEHKSQRLASFIKRHTSLEEVLLPLVNLETTFARVLTKRNTSGSFVLRRLKHIQLAFEQPLDQDRSHKLQNTGITVMEERMKDPDSCFVLHLNIQKKVDWLKGEPVATVDTLDYLERLEGRFSGKVQWYTVHRETRPSLVYLRGVQEQSWDWTGDNNCGVGQEF